MIEALTLIIAGAGLVMSVGQAFEAKNLSEMGSYYRTQITKIARELSAKLAKNQGLANELYQAYITKNTKLVSNLLFGIGYGNRIKSIYAAIDKNDSNYKKQLQILNEENSAINAQLEEVNIAGANAGLSKEGNKQAKDVLDKYNWQQAVDAGIVNNVSDKMKFIENKYKESTPASKFIQNKQGKEAN